MAAGAEAAGGQESRGSITAMESSLDRKFQGISNSMESIQGLSAWCIENKKHHVQIVRSWMKWLKKSENNHRLNLFYVANDVIQNCKRKNAIVFRSSFANVLPNAAHLIRDVKVCKSIERIFTIWEERSVYPAETIAQFKEGLNKKEEREKQRVKEKEKKREKDKDREKEKEKEKKPPPSSSAPSTTKAALKSKILAEFAPQSLIEDLSLYKQAVAEEEFREKQLATLRVDVCSSEALKRLKDKAGGNKFAKDFEEGGLKLQEFVSFLEKEMKRGPSLLESLGNADVFYEMQYKEVRIVANAYSAFASRVASLKRKLDSLKATLPGAEDSPIPSPSEDAPSPTGSDSPIMQLDVNRAQLDPELDGKAMDETNDNLEDEMDLSDEEDETTVLEENNKKDIEITAVEAENVPTTPTNSSKTNDVATAASTPTTVNTNPLGVNLAKVDLGKISSILNSLTSAMKNTTSPALKSTPGAPSTTSGPTSSITASPSPALASILSRVDITPEGILNALSKTNTPGLSSLLHSVTNSSASGSHKSPPVKSSVKTPITPIPPKIKLSLNSPMKRETPVKNKDRERQSSPPPPSRSIAPPMSTPSLESKINSFLQGNPGFSLALGDLSPDGVDGTPVRDETAGTPTQDEMMDTPGSVPESLGSSGSHPLSPTAYRSDPWDAVITPSGSNSEGDLLGSPSFGAVKKSHTKLKEEDVRTHTTSLSSKKVLKGKSDGQPGYYKNKSVAERRVSAGSRKVSTGSDDGSYSGKRDGKARGGSPGRDGKEGQYHRIETLVSPCTEGVPIESLSYSNRPLTGEPIRTVESIRVIDHGSRRGSSAGNRGGGGMWYEEEEYMESQPPPPIEVAPPLNGNRRKSEEMAPALQLPLPPLPPPHPFLHLHPPSSHSHPPPSHSHLPPSHSHPPPSHSHPPPSHSHPPPSHSHPLPSHSHPPHSHPPPPHSHHPHSHHPPSHSHHPHSHPPSHSLPSQPHLLPPHHFPLPYLNEAPPSHLHQHPPPTSPFFNTHMPHNRPPPLPQRPPTPPLHSPVPTAVMVGGVLVPVDHSLPLSLPIRQEGPDRGAPRANKGPRFMASLLGEPPQLPRPGTVKDYFGLRMAPPLHRPGTPGVPPPLLGRVKEPPHLHPPLLSPSSHSHSPPSPFNVDTSLQLIPPHPSTPPSFKPLEQREAPEQKKPPGKKKAPEPKAPVQNAPEKKVLVQNAPEKKVPVQNAPEKKVPVQNAPEKKVPVQNAPEKKVPVQNAPEKKVPVQNAPEKKVPVQNTPEKKVPVQNAPEKKVPVQNATEKKVPEQNAPEKKAPVQKAPVQNPPEEKAPVQKPPEDKKAPEQKTPVSSPVPPRPKGPPHFNMPRPLFMTEPIPQRPLVRGRLPPPSFRGFRGKRHGPPFGGPFYPPKRPFLPPRY